MTDQDALERGRRKFEEVYPMKASADPTDWERIMLEDLFGGVYQRPGLAMRDRRLLIIGVAAAQGNDNILRLQLRAGVHTGEVELRDGGPDGIAVHIAARVGDLAESDEVLVSQTVKDLTVGADLTWLPMSAAGLTLVIGDVAVSGS